MARFGRRATTPRLGSLVRVDRGPPDIETVVVKSVGPARLHQVALDLDMIGRDRERARGARMPLPPPVPCPRKLLVWQRAGEDLGLNRLRQGHGSIRNESPCARSCRKV